MGKSSQQLHYIRAIRFLNKMSDYVYNGIYNKSKEKEFFVNMSKKVSESKMAIYDLNNFLLTCCVGVMGLNKESIEKSDRNNSYRYNLKYNDTSKNIISHIYKGFQKENTIETGLEEWLSVSNVSPNISSNNNYLFNVRNALMHSEYEHNPYNEQDFVCIFLNLHNSNYTRFEGKVFLPNFYEFVKHYYSNDSFFGLQTDMYFIHAEKTNKLNKEDILEQIKFIKLYKLKYKNDTVYANMIEKKITGDKKIANYIKKHPYDKEEVVFDESELNKVKLLIDKYYGDSFYRMKYEEQMRIILCLYKYIKDPKIIISNWIMHFYYLTAGALHSRYANEDFVSVFAIEPTIAILKSYAVLYRLQNSSFQEINYDLINDLDYKFIENDLDIYEKEKSLWLKENPRLTQSQIDKKYFCEIYRDALCHGKVKIDIEEKNGIIKQILIFEDLYKNRRRIISVELEELNKFIESKAFSAEEALVKEIKDIKKR